MLQENILVELEGKDIVFVVVWIIIEMVCCYGEDIVVGFFLVDYWIGELEIFQKILEVVVGLVINQEVIVILGVKFFFFFMGYGYIEQGKKVGNFGGFDVYQVVWFIEKFK